MASDDLNGDGQPDLALVHRRSPHTEVLDLFAWDLSGLRRLFSAAFSDLSGPTGFRMLRRDGVYDAMRNDE